MPGGQQTKVGAAAPPGGSGAARQATAFLDGSRGCIPSAARFRTFRRRLQGERGFPPERSVRKAGCPLPPAKPSGLCLTSIHRAVATLASARGQAPDARAQRPRRARTGWGALKSVGRKRTQRRSGRSWPGGHRRPAAAAACEPHVPPLQQWEQRAIAFWFSLWAKVSPLPHGRRDATSGGIAMASRFGASPASTGATPVARRWRRDGRAVQCVVAPVVAGWGRLALCAGPGGAPCAASARPAGRRRASAPAARPGPHLWLPLQQPAYQPTLIQVLSQFLATHHPPRLAPELRTLYIARYATMALDAPKITQVLARPALLAVLPPALAARVHSLALLQFFRLRPLLSFFVLFIYDSLKMIF